MVEEKICESCGMPMRKISDFGGGNPDNMYCKHCTDENGKLKDFQTRLNDSANFIASRMGVDKITAEKMAKESMAKMPAWKHIFDENK